MKRKIFVADDDASLMKMLLAQLNQMGYEAFGSMDGQEALQLVRSIMPDLIILDVFLPKLNGDEITEILKKDISLKHIPVILISAAVEILEKRSQKCGADGYVSKPFEMESLLGVIKKHLAGEAK